MKPGHKHAPDTEDDVHGAPGSTVRTKRHRIDPRLEVIAEAARKGELSEAEALEQIVRVTGEWVGRMSSPEEQLATESTLRQLLSDPDVMARLAGAPTDDSKE
jgi:hypothetical protein